MRIRIRLWQRLFIAFAGLSILALATFAVLQQQGLRSGFLDYLNRLSLERVSDGAVRLGQRYDATGNWDFVRGRPDELMRILGLPPPGAGRPQPGGRGGAGSMPDMQQGPPDRGPPGGDPSDQRPPPPPGAGAWPPPPRGGPRNGGPRNGPPPFGRPRDLPPPPDANPDGASPDNRPADLPIQPSPPALSADRLQPAESASPAIDESPSSTELPLRPIPLARAVPPPPVNTPPDNADRPPPPRPAGPLDLGARLLLVDASGQYVVGNPDVPADSPSVAVMGKSAMVGRLLLAPMPKLRGDLDLSFARTQFHHALLMACAVLLGALLL